MFVVGTPGIRVPVQLAALLSSKRPTNETKPEYRVLGGVLKLNPMTLTQLYLSLLFCLTQVYTCPCEILTRMSLSAAYVPSLRRWPVSHQLSIHGCQLDRVGLSEVEHHVSEELWNDDLHAGISHVASLRKGKVKDRSI